VWTQLRYVVYDMKEKKLYFFAFLLQMVVVILLLINCLTTFYQREGALELLDKMEEEQEAYYMVLDNLADSYEWNTHEEEIFQKIHSFIQDHEDIECFSHTNQYLELTDIPKNSLYEWIEQGGIKLKVYHSFLVDSGFFDFFTLEFQELDQSIWEEWNTYKSDEIPVVLGNEYKEFYQVGDIFTDINGQRYIVKGILKKNQAFIDISFGEGRISLDRTILAAGVPANIEDISVKGNIDYEAYFSNMTLLTNNKQDILDIQEIGAQSQVYSYTLKNVKGVADYMKMETSQTIQIFSFISTLIIIFAMLMLIIQMLDFIRKKRRELAIHIFSGATKGSILLRLFLQMFVIVISAGILSAFISQEYLLVLAIDLSILCICAIVSIPATVSLFRLQISEILRRKE
jgi:hypothetical protein